MRMYSNTLFPYKLIPFLALYAVYFLGHFIDVMEVDAAQYAAISWESLTHQNFLQFYQNGVDYLDKPPLLFWVSALSYKIWGVNNFAYRFFPVLLSLLSAYATYRFAKLYFSETVAYHSALILASCQAVFLMNHDVRTDNMLTSFVAISLWQMAAYVHTKKWKNLILAFVSMGIAMLAKGPLGLMIPIFTFGVFWVVNRNWEYIWDVKYLVGIAILALVLFPMCVGLYQQFDLHPEKVVNGHTNVSGLRFYFWTQSFGRITGENSWANQPDPLFLVHTTLWSFLPWSVFLIMAYIAETINGIKFTLKNKHLPADFLLWLGLTLTFVALSRSKYQLNHYIYPIYPIAAILTAKWIEKMALWPQKWHRIINVWVLFQWAIFILLVAALSFWIFKYPSVWIILSAFVALLFAFYQFTIQNESTNKWIMLSFWSILGVNILLNAHVYPQLTHYQSESVIAKKFRDHPTVYDVQNFYLLEEGLLRNSIDFYCKKNIPRVVDIKQLPKDKWIWVGCDGTIYETKIASNPGIEVLKTEEFDDYHISKLKVGFLNPATRSQYMDKTYLLYIKVRNSHHSFADF